MSHYSAQIEWTRDGGEADFLAHRYSRRHRLRFDGGAQWTGSSSPQVVPLPHSDPAAVDPEEAFVASLASCHMLWFLALAAKRRWCVEHYLDDAVGVMRPRPEDGRLWMAEVTLRPAVRFSGAAPSASELAELHHQAHAECFIANSVKTAVRCEPRDA